MNPDFIEVYDNLLSSKKCHDIIDHIEGQELSRAAFSGVVHTSIKDAWQIGGVMNDKSLASKHIHKALCQATAMYVETHPQVQLINKWGLEDRFNYQKYDPGQGYYQSHTENTGHYIFRMMVWMIYLNTVSDEGGTWFEEYGKKTDAVEGRIVIWPAYWTHFHKGIVSQSETKYIATGWYEFKDKTKVYNHVMNRGTEY